MMITEDRAAIRATAQGKATDHHAYWRRNQRVTIVLLTIWFVVTFVVSYFARELSAFTFFGFPFSFYMGAQGALIVYVLIIWFYARYMNSLDREYGIPEVDEP